MGQIAPGRFHARTDEPLVVFVIGMRVNNLLAVWKWLLTMRAMPPMLKELYQHPEKSFLGAAFFFHLREPVTLQYRRSFEDLEKFARNPDDPHVPARQRFNRTVGSDGSVGIFHETYIVEPGPSRRSLATCRSSHSSKLPSTSGRSEAGRRRGGARAFRLAWT